MEVKTTREKNSWNNGAFPIKFAQSWYLGWYC